MVFSSLFFVFFFFALCTAGLFFLPSVRTKNILLLVFSLIFYAWGGPLLLLLLCGMTLVIWLGALCIDAVTEKFYKGLILFVTLSAALIALLFFKYSTFLAESLQAVFHFGGIVPQIALPIGISFYTFQLISYAVDVYRGEVPAQRKYWMLLLYASLFHQCVAGPIVRYRDVCAELTDRRETVADLSAGISRFAAGLCKKAVLANTAGALVAELWAEPSLAGASSGTVFLGGVFYMLQIYLDFSAYSDMAIGMGRMAGIHYIENFNYPYIASSITDFWRRWHISLSSFFRDYVYIPLGGNRKGFPRQIFNLFVVWALTGFWHGASWNYPLWGLYYFVFLVAEKLFARYFPNAKLPKYLRPLSHIGTLLVVYFGWMIFYFEDLSMLGTALSSLFGANGFWDLSAKLALFNNIFFLLLAAVACTPVVNLCRRAVEKLPRFAPAWAVADALSPVLLLILSLIFLVGNTYNPFLYFQF